MERIPVKSDILKSNQEKAAENRQKFADNNLLVINIMSSPGAGKTTLLEGTIKALRGSCRLAVIEGDLQTDLDAKRIQALGIPSHQITTGTVCHLDSRMVARALEEFPVAGLDLLIIENVGNLICPSSFDLGESVRVVVCSVAEGPEKPKKYPGMFRKADVVLINKIDLDPSGHERRELEANVREVNPEATIFALSARTGDGVSEWVSWLKESIERFSTHTMASAT